MENNNENLVPNGTENVETTPTEEIVENGEQVETPAEKIYTQAEFDAKLDEGYRKKIGRKEAKIRKEYDDKYGELIGVLQKGTGEQDVKKITQSFKQFYEGKGVDVSSKQPNYSEKDIAVLAKAEAQDIIDSGIEEVADEVDRLAKLGVENMSARDKAVFMALREHQRNTERNNKLAELGVTEDIYNSKDFQDFAAMFTSNTPIEKILNLFNNQTKPKKEIKTMGSVKNNNSDNGTVKDFYSYEEASKFTKADFDKNPKLYEAVQNSMRKWK